MRKIKKISTDSYIGAWLPSPKDLPRRGTCVSMKYKVKIKTDTNIAHIRLTTKQISVFFFRLAFFYLVKYRAFEEVPILWRQFLSVLRSQYLNRPHKRFLLIVGVVNADIYQYPIRFLAL